MNKLQSVVKQVVLAHIDMEYVTDCGHTSVGEVYQVEYGYNGTTPKACKDYLQGLPSVCTIPFMNFDILELLEKNGITAPTEKGRDSLIEKYWTEAGNQFYQLVRWNRKA